MLLQSFVRFSHAPLAQQSVAMDHYARLIDNMMVEFERLSIRLQAAGGKFNIPKKKLFTLVSGCCAQGH